MGAEVVARVDSIQRLLYEGADPVRLRVYWEEVLMWVHMATVLGDLTVQVNHQDRSYTGFVFERVVVRMNPADGYPCPLVRRTLVAWPKGWDRSFRAHWDFLTVAGADFTAPISPDGSGVCAAHYHSLPPGPVARWLGSANALTQVGIRGSAAITSTPSTTACQRTHFRDDPRRRMTCERKEYEIALKTHVAPAGPGRGTAVTERSFTTIDIPPQRVPGLRVRVYCDTLWAASLEGCAWNAYDDSMKIARLCRLDSLHNDTLRILALRRGDTVDNWSPPPCPWIESVRQERRNTDADVRRPSAAPPSSPPR